MRQAMLQTIREHYGALHVLVNNAGVAPLERYDAMETTEESFERLMRINLQGPHFLTQKAAKWNDRTAEGMPGLSRLHCERDLNFIHHGFDKPSGILYFKGRIKHVHKNLGRAAGGIQYSGI